MKEGGDPEADYGAELQGTAEWLEEQLLQTSTPHRTTLSGIMFFYFGQLIITAQPWH